MKSISVVKRNVIANTIGGIWVLGLGLFLVPTQFKILGSEILGLLGFVLTLQTIFSIFDFGLGPTLLREVASDTSSDRIVSRDLIQAVSFVYWVVAAILGLSLALASSWFIDHWVTLDQLSREYAMVTIQILALRLFFTWPIVVYVNILSGIQRLDIVNALRVFIQTLSVVGGIVILLIWKELHLFLLWTISVNLLSLILHIMACYRFFPLVSLLPRFSISAFRRVWRFSLDMNILAVQGIALTQVDNMLVSYLMPLKMLGYYTGAYSINQYSLGTLGNILSNAMLPTLSEDFGYQRTDLVKLRFQKYTQIVTYIAMVPSFIFIFWGYDVLRIWTTLEVAEEAYVTLAILSIGFLLHTLMMPYLILCIATQNTRIPRDVNWVGVTFYLITCYVLILKWGINGAAAAWMLLNAYYHFTILPLTQARVLNASPFSWFPKNFLPFTLVAFICFGAGRAILEVQPVNHELVIWTICAVSMACYGLVGYFFLEKQLQQDILQIVVRTVNKVLSFLNLKRNR